MKNKKEEPVIFKFRAYPMMDQPRNIEEEKKLCKENIIQLHKLIDSYSTKEES